MRGKFLGGPPVLIPTTPLNPLTRSSVFRPGFDARDDFVVGAGSGKIHSLQHRAEPEQVGMGVSDPGQDCSAMEINDGCRRPRQRSCLSIRADKQDSSTADRDRRDDWPRVVDGVNVAVG